MKIFHNNLVGMILTDKDHLITDVNDHLLHLTELERKDTIGKTGIELGLMHQSFVEKMWQQMSEQGRLSNIELSITTKKSKKDITILFSTEKIEIDNKLHWLTTIIDISKKKKAEEKISESELRFRTLTSTAPVGIFETDEKGQTTYVNETWLEYTGLSFEEAMGDAWMSLIHPEDRDMEVNTWYSKTERAEMSHSEYRIIDKNGRLRWINGKAVPVISKAGRITGYIGTITDVTERKLAMESLRQSEETLNRAQRISKTGSWEINASTLELTWSKEQYRIFELEDEPVENLYEAYKRKYHPGDIPKLEAIRKAIEKAEDFTHEYRIICNDGSIKYIFGIGEVVLDAEGKVTGVKGTCQDITEYKKIENEILESHQRMDTLINTIDGIVWEADAVSFKFTFVSKKAEQILGFPVEQWIAEQNFWANHMHPDDRGWAVEYCLRATREKRKHDFEYRMIARDGSVLWLRDIVTVITENDQPVQLRGIMVNITERRKAEEAISYNASLLENVSDAILSLDAERRIISWNKASELMYGYTKEEVLGRRIPEIVVFEFPGTNNEAVFKEVLEKGNWKGEIYFIHPKNGKQLFVLGNINLLRNREGKITGFIATSKDITDRKMVENALNERTEQLRELSTHLQEVREEERTNIAREIHDELGQQLTGLKMDITWLKKRVKTEDPLIKNKFTESIKLIDASVKTIRRIVTELRPSIIDDLGLNAALEWHVVDFGKKLGIVIQYVNDFDDEHIKPAISIGLFRILQESLTNIAKHAKAKNVTINIGQVRDSIQLCVQDDGVGFDAGVKQIDKTFGLLGIKERANKMNGDCFIDSSPGAGTKIQVRIPL
ncbi:MAG TPA: PAS domain S-box protein [Ferruginibacter sp.]|nr:PAS domain S-box protein [Ferruginibacter sp.]